jgi:hypothetical protein
MIRLSKLLTAPSNLLHLHVSAYKSVLNMIKIFSELLETKQIDLFYNIQNIMFTKHKIVKYRNDQEKENPLGHFRQKVQQKVHKRLTRGAPEARQKCTRGSP